MSREGTTFIWTRNPSLLPMVLIMVMPVTAITITLRQGQRQRHRTEPLNPLNLIRWHKSETSTLSLNLTCASQSLLWSSSFFVFTPWHNNLRQIELISLHQLCDASLRACMALSVSPSLKRGCWFTSCTPPLDDDGLGHLEP